MDGSEDATASPMRKRRRSAIRDAITPRQRPPEEPRDEILQRCRGRMRALIDAHALPGAARNSASNIRARQVATEGTVSGCHQDQNKPRHLLRSLPPRALPRSQSTQPPAASPRARSPPAPPSRCRAPGSPGRPRGAGASATCSLRSSSAHRRADASSCRRLPRHRRTPSTPAVSRTRAATRCRRAPGGRSPRSRRPPRA